MKYKKLGRTDISVSTISMGCWAIIGDETWGPQDEADSIAAIHAALDAGVNFFDTAEGYGQGASEQLLGRVFAGQPREKLVIATKVGRFALTFDELIRHCEASLTHLRTDYIDLYQVHWPSPKIPIDETLRAMDTLLTQGKIRVAGVSNFGVSYLNELLAAGRVEANQLCYSLLWRPIEHEVQPICVENDLSILCYSPLCQGLLTGKFSSPTDVPDSRARTRLFSSARPHARHGEPGLETETFRALAEIAGIARSINQPMNQVALAWLLAQPGVTSVIAGARNAEQARLNARAADVELSAEVLDALDRATCLLKERVGPNADLWQHDSRMERPAQ